MMIAGVKRSSANDFSHHRKEKIRLCLSCTFRHRNLQHFPRLISQLRDLLHNGIEIAIHIKERGFNEKDLLNAGIDVIHREDLSIQYIIIDKSIVWYGNINFFGYNNEENNVMRICLHSKTVISINR